VAAEIGTAARKVGFLYVSRTGIDEGLFDRLFAATKTFFAPVERRWKLHRVSSCHRGYVPVGRRVSRRERLTREPSTPRSTFPTRSRPRWGNPMLVQRVA
jgi:isopenicillin N synthase-like dioxygenase